MSSQQHIKIKNRTFESMMDAAEFFNIPLSTAARRKKEGWTPEQIFGIQDAPSTSRATGDLPNVVILSHEGKDFKTVNDFAKHFHINPDIVRTQVHKNMSGSEIIEFQNEKNNSDKKIKLDGKYFKSPYELAKYYNANTKNVTDRLNDGWSPAQAVGLMPKPESEDPYQDVISLTVNSKNFNTIGEIAEHHQLNLESLIKEISSGKSTQVAVDDLLLIEKESIRQLLASKKEAPTQKKIEATSSAHGTTVIIKKKSKLSSKKVAEKNLIDTLAESAQQEIDLDAQTNKVEKKVVTKKLVDEPDAAKEDVKNKVIEKIISASDSPVDEFVESVKKERLVKSKVVEKNVSVSDRPVAKPVESVKKEVLVKNKAVEKRVSAKKITLKKALVKPLINAEAEPFVEASIEPLKNKNTPKTVTTKPVQAKTSTPKSVPIIVDGKTFGSKFQVAKHYRITPTLFYKRINLGDTCEAAVAYFEGKIKDLTAEQIGRRGRPGKAIDYDGKTFASVRDFAKYYNTEPHKVSYRLGKKWTLAQSIGHDARDEVVSEGDADSFRNREIHFNGKMYRSIRALSGAFKVSPHKVRYRLKNGWTVEQAVEKCEPPATANSPKGEAKELLNISDISPFKIDDMIFPTAKALADHYGANPAKVTGRLRNGWTVDQSVGVTVAEGAHKNTRPEPVGDSTSPVMVDNTKYRSIYGVAKHFDCSVNVLKKRLSNDWTIEQAVGLDDEPENQQLSEKKQVSISALAPFLIDGKTFKTANALAKHYKLDPSKVTGRLRNRWSVSQAVEIEEHSIGDKKEVKYNVGKKTFVNAVELAEFYSLSYRIVNYRISQGASAAQAVGVDPWVQSVQKGKEVEFNGQTYKSLISLAKTFGADYSKMLGRLHRGWSISKALGVKCENAEEDISTASIVKKEKIKNKGTLIKRLTAQTQADVKLKLGRKIFLSIEEFAKSISVDPVIASRRLKEGWTTKQIAGLDLPPGW